MGITLATTVYEAEVELLMHQARSFSKFLPSETTAAVIVIDNTRRGISPKTARELERAYGGVWPKVTVLRPDEIARVPRSTGWRSQQILKLALARRIETSHYIVFDAKNHLIRKFELYDFVGADRRSRIPAYSYVDHPLRPSLELVLQYVGLGDFDVSSYSATTTPFTLDTSLVRDMLSDIEGRSGRPFESEFLAHGLTEFFLYSAWVRKTVSNYESLIEDVPQTALTVWPSRCSDENVRELVGRAMAENAGVFSVHRSSFPRLTQSARLDLANFWVRLGFYANVDEAYVHIERMRKNFKRWDLFQKLSDVPGRVATRLRRARRRTGRT